MTNKKKIGIVTLSAAFILSLGTAAIASSQMDGSTNYDIVQDENSINIIESDIELGDEFISGSIEVIFDDNGNVIDEIHTIFE